VITEHHISVPGRRLAWADLEYVQIAKPNGWLVRAFTKEQPLYQIRVAKKGKPSTAAKAIFSTQDAALVSRVE
jgi:hypothetical protein